jgi:prenyltransferase beta subunit
MRLSDRILNLGRAALKLNDGNQDERGNRISSWNRNPNLEYHRPHRRLADRLVGNILTSSRIERGIGYPDPLRCEVTPGDELMNLQQKRAQRSLLMVILQAFFICFLPCQIARSAQPASRTPEANGLKLVTSQAQIAINKGLAYIASRQQADGSFGSGHRYSKNVAVTALCGMAFLSAGHTPGRGKYGQHVQKAIDYLLSCTRPNGFIIDKGWEENYHGPMYGHGFATLFLCEVYGMTPRGKVRDELGKKLRIAVKLIFGTQNEEGGWRYQPEPRDADMSVTVCQIMALRAARNCGLYVPKKTINRCIEYVRKGQNSDGGFRYQLTGRKESRFPLSAAGVVAVYSAGVYKGREIEEGLGYLNRFRPDGRAFRFSRYYFYGHYYAIQAMWHAGGSHWQQWYSAIRDELMDYQDTNGSWTRPSNMICLEYNTAMACLVLQMPNNYLPIFQR